MEQFEVVFYDDDNETILDRQNVSKGESVTYNGTKTEKEEDNMRFVLVGWIGEEKMESVEEDLKLVAKYEPIILENKDEKDEETAYYEATVESTKKATLSSTIEAGTRITEHQLALERDKRTPQEIVAEVLEKGSVEIGIDEKQEVDDKTADDFEK